MLLLQNLGVSPQQQQQQRLSGSLANVLTARSLLPTAGPDTATGGTCTNTPFRHPRHTHTFTPPPPAPTQSASRLIRLVYFRTSAKTLTFSTIVCRSFICLLIFPLRRRGGRAMREEVGGDIVKDTVFTSGEEWGLYTRRRQAEKECPRPCPSLCTLSQAGVGGPRHEALETR